MAVIRAPVTITVWSRFGAAPVPSITVACTNANDVGLPLSFCCTVRAETRTAATTTAPQAIDERITTPREAVNDFEELKVNPYRGAVGSQHGLHDHERPWNRVDL